MYVGLQGPANLQTLSVVRLKKKLKKHHHTLQASHICCICVCVSKFTTVCMHSCLMCTIMCVWFVCIQPAWQTNTNNPESAVAFHSFTHYSGKEVRSVDPAITFSL